MEDSSASLGKSFLRNRKVTMLVPLTIDVYTKGFRSTKHITIYVMLKGFSPSAVSDGKAIR